MARKEKEWGIYTPKKWQREKGLTGQYLFHGDKVVAILHERGKLFFPRGEEDLKRRTRIPREKPKRRR